MQPTAKALEIADQVRTLLIVADGLRASATVFDPVRSDRTFSLLLTDVGMIRFLPPLIAHVAAIAPRVNIRATPLGLTPVRAQAGSRRGRFSAWRISERGSSPAASTIVFRRLRHRRSQWSSEAFGVAVPLRISGRA